MIKQEILQKKFAEKIMQCLNEAVIDGGYGIAMPLKTLVYVGSEYGRHRSVVVCEVTAKYLRDLLRGKEDQNDTLKMAGGVSVGTMHRDVDHDHRDEEAFGKDLQRLAKLEKKEANRRLSSGDDPNYVDIDDDVRW